MLNTEFQLINHLFRGFKNATNSVEEPESIPLYKTFFHEIASLFFDWIQQSRRL